MAKARGLEAKLARLKLIRHDEHAPEHVAELRAALSDKSNFVVSEAAEMVGERMLTDLVPDLVAAFHRFLIAPTETDKLCRAKIAIVEALNKLEYDEEDLFLIGLRHVQKEAAWGKPEDTAAPLRGSSAFGLVRIRPRGVALLLADLLADPEKVARQNAAQALGSLASEAAIVLLRFKAKLGDQEADVIGECLTALMSAEPRESLAFVGSFLDSAEEGVAEGAALAIAESRTPEAFATLKAHWPKARRNELGSVLLLAISITRQSDAIEFLIGILSEKDEKAAIGALSALAIHKHNPAVRDRVEAVVKKSASRALKDGFARAYAKSSL